MPISPLSETVNDAAATARRWADECRAFPEPRTAKLLADVLSHEGGLRFTLDFVDQVLRPEDPRVAAAALSRLASQRVDFLPAPLRIGLRQVVGRAPLPLLPVVRRVFTAMVGDLVVDVGRSLGPALKRLTAGGADLNVNLLGEAVLGEKHAARRLDATMALLGRDDIDYVSIKVSAVLGAHAPWGEAAAVDNAVERLRPLLALAARTGKFVNLDMEEYRDLHLTLDVFERLLSEPDLLGLRAGVAVQTYLRESPLVLDRIDEFAAARVAKGGAPVKVRLVKGANLAMERVQAELHGWELPVLDSKEATDASFLDALDRCLVPERAARVNVGVASHNVFSLATAWELAKARGVTDAVDIEMLSGMAVPLQRVIMREAGSLRLYVPVVPRDEYDAAISYLVRRLEENAAPENFMSGAANLGTDAAFLDREERRFRAAAAHEPQRPTGWAEQHRSPIGAAFSNTQDTDPALTTNQRWAESIRAALPAPTLGAATLAAATLDDEAGVDAAIARGVTAGDAWAALSPAERARHLHRLGDELEAARAELITAAADEVGKLIDQGDVEVSEACDFAHYYAGLALDEVDGATHVPPRLTLVASPWNFPIAIPLGGVAAALAAGSAVILKPASPARRIAALLAEACWRAGIPRDVAQLVVVDDGPLGRSLVTDARIEQVVLTGAAETAEMFRSWRPDLPLLAETSGKNAVVVMPSADLDLAAADLVASAFGHAGQKCSAASLGILVGSVAKSRRFRDQLIDAAASLTLAWPSDPSAELGPLTELPGDKLLRGLTELGPGESWLLKPRQISERLWRPGIRTGVRPGSEFHQVEYFGPVLGLMEAGSLDEAIAWQNGTAYGLTAGIHSLEAGDVQTWIDSVQAGNLYVNRTITGAIVRRQPFGGWKRSVVGPTTKAGGPNYLAAFGRWEPAPTRAVSPEATDPALARLVRSVGDLGGDGFAAVVAGDEAAARTTFWASHDPSALASELNVLRYRSVPVTVRVEGADLASVLRELSASVAARGKVSFSFRDEPSERLVEVLESLRVPSDVATDEEFDRTASGRIRFLGDRDLRSALGGDISVTVYDGPSLPAGRIAMLPYLREQAVCVTNHRFGHPSPLTPHLSI
ncbi:hypothetical protein BW730_03820 [Tessaracoccus aquimaris]|uniref:L-glutamate gamma-semialdehyde dehydrogenase n=1 Tax=Tessaracoccus aquimaris TaxID=1332264 RepID=A0A1Q2CL36_9ACTN|nr:bifunctional proline dehydrogenase/L-glutamate gamma-semialdehyde dehydrogenase [Tessaracoccus aquimaris]AQP46785.1 hypothetical protein BW730_03820 [Tessaracoccus aquimaris]